MAKAKKQEEVMFDFDETVEETVVEEKVETPKKKSKAIVKEDTVTYKDDDMIPCKSVTSGGLSFIGFSGTKYRFADYGMVEYVSYGDLKREAQSVNPLNYLYYPRFVVIDPAFVEKFPKLEDFYNQFYMEDGEFDKILDLPKERMIEEIAKLPRGCKESLKGIVATRLANGTLDSVQKVKALDEIFGTKLLSLAND